MIKSEIMTDPFDESRTQHVLAVSLLENKGYQKLMRPKIETEIETLTRQILEDVVMDSNRRESLISKRLAWVEMRDYLDAVKRESDRFLNQKH